MILNMKNPWVVMMMLTNESSLKSSYECYDGVVLWGRACEDLEVLGELSRMADDFEPHGQQFASARIEPMTPCIQSV